MSSLSSAKKLFKSTDNFKFCILKCLNRLFFESPSKKNNELIKSSKSIFGSIFSINADLSFFVFLIKILQVSFIPKLNSSSFIFFLIWFFFSGFSSLFSLFLKDLTFL